MKNSEFSCVKARCCLKIILLGYNYYVEKSIEVTSSYSTFDSAIYYFLTTCSILDAKDYFPSAWNVSLFEK